MVFGERWTSRGAGDTNSLPRLDVAVQGATTEVVFLPYARLAIATSCVGTITRTYDDLDRLRSDTTAQGVISYTYDAADRRATMTVAGQLQVTYGYDDANRLTSVTQGTATVTITHDNADRRSPGEVARRCRGNPVGCSFAGVFNVKCNCQCDASSKRWRLSMDVSYGQATIIISNQLGGMAGQVAAHEYGHIRDAVNALAAAKPAAERLEQVPYASKAQCEQACKDWEKDVRDTIDRAAAWTDGLMNWLMYWLTRK